MASLAAAVAAAGDHDRAARLATRAKQIARSLTNPSWQARALADLAGRTLPARTARQPCDNRPC